MTTLTRWEPWREMLSLRQAMNRFWDEPFESRLTMPWRTDEFALDVDVTEDETAYTVKASLPGVKPEDVEVTMQNNVLTIKGKTTSEETREEAQYHLRERRYGSFLRSLTMPTTVTAEQIEANQEHGVLTVRLPKSEGDKPKQIAVKSVPNGNGKS